MRQPPIISATTGPNEFTPGDAEGDGAVRELEKEALAAQRPRKLRPDSEAESGVISLGKDSGGAPEDAVHDSKETP